MSWNHWKSQKKEIWRKIFRILSKWVRNQINQKSYRQLLAVYNQLGRPGPCYTSFARFPRSPKSEWPPFWALFWENWMNGSVSTSTSLIFCFLCDFLFKCITLRACSSHSGRSYSTLTVKIILTSKGSTSQLRKVTRSQISADSVCPKYAETCISICKKIQYLISWPYFGYDFVEF